MTDYKQVVIAQIGSTNPADRFVPFEGLIWAKNYYLTQAEQDASFWTTKFNATYEDVNTQDISINTVTWDGQQLSRYDSLEELSFVYVQDAFFFDDISQVLYIKNFYNYPPWQTTGMSVGIVQGYSSMADVGPDNRPFNEAYFGQEHEPRLIQSSVDDYQELEDWKYNQMVFKNATISLINSDGALDNIREQVMNQRMDILLADTAGDKEIISTDFNVVTTGIVSDVSFPNENTVTITASDRRKSWDDTLPQTYYTEGFGGIPADSEAIGKNMQVVFGTARKVPCIPLNQDDGTYHVTLVPPGYTMVEVTEVYDFSGNEYTTLSYSVDLTTGIIEINQPQKGGVICCDCTGLIAQPIDPAGTVPNTPLDIAMRMIELFGNMPYVDSLFDIATINSIRNERNYPASVYIPPNGEILRDVVEALTFSVNTVLYQKGSKITASTITADSTPKLTLYPDELTAMPGIIYDNRDYFSRIQVSYDKDHTRDVYNTILDDQYEQSAVALYQFKVQYDFTTVCYVEANAVAMALERYGLSWNITPDLEVSFTAPIGFDFMDTVDFHYMMNGREMLPNARYRVTGLSKINRTAKLEYIEEVTA